MTSPTIPVPTETVLDEDAEHVAFQAWCEQNWPGRYLIPDIAWMGWLGRAALAASPALASPVPSDAGVMGLEAVAGSADDFASAAEFEEMCDALGITPDAGHWKVLYEMERAAHAEAAKKLKAFTLTFDMMHDTSAERDVVFERARQKGVEGYDDAHDDVLQHGQLGAAAACYALTGSGTFPPISAMPPGFWPWDLKWWKPSADRRDLVRAGALILAEIERLDRAALASEAPR